MRLAKEIYRAEGSRKNNRSPILYDKQAGRIVNNESAEIIRMLGHAAAALGSTAEDGEQPDLYPDDMDLRSEIDTLNAQIYTTINNGSLQAGFSSDQAVYAQAFEAYFDTLSQLDERLDDGRPFLTGSRLTEADLRLLGLDPFLPA